MSQAERRAESARPRLVSRLPWATTALRADSSARVAAGRRARSLARGSVPHYYVLCVDAAVVGEDQSSVVQGDCRPSGQRPFAARRRGVKGAVNREVLNENTTYTGRAKLDSVTNGTVGGCGMDRFALAGIQADAQYRRRGG